MNCILVNGYGCTGSSAVIDYLKEFDNVKVPAAEKEFRIIKDPYGIIDLDRAINNLIDPLNADIAIKKFIWMTDKYIRKPGKFTGVRCGYLDDFGENIRVQTDRYIEALSGRKYDGYWWYMDMEKSAHYFFIKKLLRRLGLKDFETYEKIVIPTLSEEEFIKITRDYLQNIFAPLINDEKSDYIALDNAIPPTKSSFADRYFEKYKMINVERDPRDIYVNLCYKKLMIGYYSAKTHDPSLFVEWYKKMREHREDSRNVMTVWFEDFVTKHENTCKQICSFCSLSEEAHTMKKQFFNPDKSVKDIGLWKRFPHKKEIDYIINALRNYLYTGD